MRSTILTVLTFAVTTSLISDSRADVVKIEIPLEKGVFKARPGAEIAQANCLVCHSVEYVTTQPPMNRKFWEASVKKMREKYGAMMADEAATALVDYLVTTYGTADSPK